MPTLTPTLFPCYAAADREVAHRIAEFLERGADVRVFLDEGELRDGEDLASKARDGRTADIVLVLFSRNSWPARLPRAQWEGPFVNEPREEGVRIGFAKCDDCVPPPVLVPLFDLSVTASKGLRQIKRWVRTTQADLHVPSHEPEIELVGIAIADRPGIETVDDSALAMEFARAFRDDFEEVVVLECGARSITALAGDLGARLGMQLEGPLESNLDRLYEFCGARRFLIVLDDMGFEVWDALVFGGRCSTLISRGRGLASPPDPIREAQRILAEGTADWAEICHQAWQGRRLLGAAGRLAECYELMSQWREAAEARQDREALRESERELAWIRQGWDFTEPGPDPDDGERDSGQMTLPFS